MFTWLYNLIKLLVEKVFRLPLTNRWGATIHFFIYDIIKIIILLFLMIFIISYIRSYFPPEKTKKLLGNIKGIKGNILASLLGIVTPFCSCSSVPLFIGFVEGGIPLGVTFSFLITSPIINEAAVAILLASFGWKITVAYVVVGVIVGVFGGFFIGKLKMEKHVQEYVYNIKMGESTEIEKTQKERISFALTQVKEIIKRVYIYLIIGIGIGALIHGWIPKDFVLKYANANNPFAVLVAVVFGVPLYSNALGTIPIAEALINKGVGIGTALAFMMATTALSLPEMLLLKKVIKPKLIFAFVVIVSFAIILVGYLFNWLAPWLM